MQLNDPRFWRLPIRRPNKYANMVPSAQKGTASQRRHARIAARVAAAREVLMDVSTEPTDTTAALVEYNTQLEAAMTIGEDEREQTP